MKYILDISSSTAASTVRNWRGCSSSKSATKAEKLLELYDRENDPECRLVREALTESNQDAIVYPIPADTGRFKQRLIEVSKNNKLPFLYDPNTDSKLTGAEAINTYLFKTYLSSNVPKPLQANKKNRLQSALASKLRWHQGTASKPSQLPGQLLELYSFEGSPYCRLVRELLCELSIPYVVRQLGKQQRADFGPAVFRFHRGEYKPLPGSRRESLLQQYGQVQVPLLIDPNTDQAIFESKDIIQHIKEHYAE